MITMYDTPRSGHCYRVRLLLGFLGRDFRSVPVIGAERKAAWFLAINPFGEVPAIDDDGVILADSAAILVYIAKKYDADRRWLPVDPVVHARVQRWLSVAAGELVQGVAALRMHARTGRPVDVPRATVIATTLLQRMEAHLATEPFLAAPHATIADLALYSYLVVASEGGFDLGPYEAVRAWFARIERLDGFVPMPLDASS